MGRAYEGFIGSHASIMFNVLTRLPGTPVPGGLSFRQAVAVLARVVESGRTIVGFDLGRVAPGPGGDEWNANGGRACSTKLIGLALRSQDQPKKSL